MQRQDAGAEFRMERFVLAARMADRVFPRTGPGLRFLRREIAGEGSGIHLLFVVILFNDKKYYIYLIISLRFPNNLLLKIV